MPFSRVVAEADTMGSQVSVSVWIGSTYTICVLNLGPKRESRIIRVIVPGRSPPY